MTGLLAEFVVDREEGFRLEVDLGVPAGSTGALLGPNGAGKSTAVAAIAGLVPIDTGRITIDGTVVDDPAAGVFVPPENRPIGAVFQDDLLFPHMSVLDNVAFGLRSRGRGRDEAAEAARDWLQTFGLSELEGRRPSQLSGGQARRVALARALVVQPRLLLLDEPLASLDVGARAELRAVLADHLDAFEGPRLLVTHDPAEAFLLADEIIVMEGGRVTQRGTADEIRLAPRTRYAADLAGINLLRGVAARGVVETGGHRLTVVDDGVEGPVLVTIHPSAVAIHRHRPEGSPRNVWSTRVERIEQLGHRVRLLTGHPLPLAVEVTDRSVTELDLTPGTEVWVAVKATEITVLPHP